MYTGIEMLKMASAMARHAGDRQTVVAGNIANADTPGYRARDLPSFADAYREPRGAAALTATRAGHFTAPLDGAAVKAHAEIQPGDASPNGNTVSLESEMIKASAVRHDHQLALSVYRSGLDLLRAGLGRVR